MRSSVRSRLAPPYFQSLASTPSSAARILCRGLCRNLSFCSLNSPNPPAASRANRGRCASPGGLWGEPAQQRKQLIGGARLAEVAFHLSTCGVIWNSMPRVCANFPTRFGGTDPLSSYITSSFENGLEDCAPAKQENANVQNMETRVCRVFNWPSSVSQRFADRRKRGSSPVATLEQGDGVPTAAPPRRPQPPNRGDLHLAAPK